MSALKQQLNDAIKAAMKSREKARLLVLRNISAAIKQREVDERITLDDTQIIPVLDKMAKQRRESIEQYSNAGREDLKEIEAAELVIIQEFLPQPLSDAELNALITSAIETAEATSMRDMGKVMAIVKPKAQGRADMSQVSAVIKSQLS